MNIPEYFKSLETEVHRSYAAAGEARKVGLDPALTVEVPVATTLAERVTGLVSVLYPQINDPRIVARILELEKKYGPLDPAIALTIAEEVAKQMFCTFETPHEAMEAGIRIALGYLTLGYVSSPIEGFIQLKLKDTADGKAYFAPYYSGPIRSAGGTEAAFSLVIVDYLRDIFGYAKYDPTDDEVKRGIHECYEYHERITNLQYLPSEQELDFLLRNIPVQISGDASEELEVFNYKDLPRIETNFLRSGFCLVTGEGLAQKAPKILGRIVKLREKGFTLKGWDWLDEYCKLQKKIKEQKKGDASRAGATYIQDLVGGRPVFAHPSQSGAFRLRYGRCRNTGYSTLAAHPATMAITDGFIAVGTQLKIEKPTKGCTVASCDTIDGPIVKLQDGSVKYITDATEAKRICKQISEIIYLGDLLVPFGDFLNRNHVLEKAGYVEQYWLVELKSKGGESELHPSFEKAVELSKTYGLGLHPQFIYFWREISVEQFTQLIDWIAHGSVREGKLSLPWGKQEQERFSGAKRALELLGCEHDAATEDVVLSVDHTKAFLFNLGISLDALEEGIGKAAEALKKAKDLEEAPTPLEGEVAKPVIAKKTLDFINELCTLKIEDKSGTYIGARMGRPEKAKLRVLIGSPHVLFPVGSEGGRLRSVIEALDNGKVTAEFPLYYCNACQRDNVYIYCEHCTGMCEQKTFTPEQYAHGGGKPRLPHNYQRRSIDIRSYFDKAKKKLGLRIEELPSVIKGVKGTSNKEHACEYLGKGLLRAKYNLHVNKDGTIRYDMTEMPLTHFRPAEIGTSVAKLMELGYEKDIDGKPLERADQLVEMFPHDIVLPACPETPDEQADDVFINVAKFIDDEFEKLYKLPRFFNVKNKEDLAGHLMCCMSPHTSATVIGRLIGFSKVQALLASPYIHGAMRRDCDGDEAAVMFLMDLLVNFSRKFIPAHRGGTQDAPLVLNMRIRANEVDDMVFDLDVSKEIPLALYEAAKEKKSPNEVKMDKIKGRLGGEEEFTNLHISYDTSDINLGPLCSSYKTLPTMQDKVDGMMNLCSKIRAVDLKDVARLIIERHFIRDTRGNLRKFSMQAFRCIGCNESYRRPPLTGKCTACGGRLIFTISEGSILKYMQPALNLARTYGVSAYLLESLELNQMYIESIFGRDSEKQETINKWF